MSGSEHHHVLDVEREVLGKDNFLFLCCFMLLINHSAQTLKLKSMLYYDVYDRMVI